MSISLDPTLANAQDSQSHHPLVEILSQPSVPDIPFDGAFLTSETTNEQKPNAITHSSGRICLVYGFGASSTDLKYAYTDTERTAFTITAFNAYQTIIEATLCELADGNVGIIYVSKSLDESTRYLRRMVISPTGEVVAADALIASYTTANYVIDMPFVTRLASGTYLLAYYHKTVSGPVYVVMKRTSADFLTWGSESACSISGLDTAAPCYSPSLIQLANGDVWMWIEYRDDYIEEDNLELTNIYYSVSTDDGATWSAATKITNYTTFGEVAKHPIAFQKTINQMYMIYTKQMGSLHVNLNMFNWCGPQDKIDAISFDSVNRKLYLTALSSNFSTGPLSCIVKVDVDTWSIERCWSTSTSPGFSPIFAENINLNTAYGQSYLIPLMIAGSQCIGVLDGEANTIKEYYFQDVPAYSLTKNVTWTQWDIPLWSNPLKYCWVDFASRRLYCLLTYTYPYGNGPGFQFGYIDLNQEGPNYTFVEIGNQQGGIIGENAGFVSDFFVIPELNYVVITSCPITMRGGYPTTQGMLFVLTLDQFAIVKRYSLALNAGFPQWSLSHCRYYNGKIYGSFPHEPLYGEEEKRGLCIVDLNTDIVTYSRPTWATLDDYKLNRFHVTDDGKLIISTEGYGITIYDTNTGGWSLYDNDRIPGLTYDSENNFDPVDFDDATGLVFAGRIDNVLLGYNGISAFNINGFIEQTQYMVGDNTGTWDFGTFPDNIDDFVQGWMDYDAVVALDPTDQTIYAFWTEKNLTELSLKWDKEQPNFDLSALLVKGSEVSLKRSVDGTPGSLTFQVAYGHLFDPHNSLSLWKIYLAKFRKINIRFGERIAGFDFWQQQGVFYVTETKIDPGYERPKYPTMTVRAEDRLAMFEFAELVTTPYYSTYPETIIQNILENFGGMVSGDINIGTFATRATCYIQWIQQPIKAIIDQLTERFGYYSRIDIDGKATAKKISDSNAVDHVYSDLTKLVNLTPDDSFSDWINQVTVKGDGRDWLEVLYNEEPCGQLSGSCGWWNEDLYIPIWFSTDHSRKGRYPRMEVIESVHDGPHYMKDGYEEFTAMADELGLTVHIYGPHLKRLLAMAMSIWTMWKMLAVIANAIPYYGGMIALVFWIGETFAWTQVTKIMDTQGNYQYNFYVRPVGYVRQNFQASAPTSLNDKALQTLMGFIEERTISDPLCYSISQCQEVADFEWMVTKNQRKRLKAEKVAHLQDEDGDTIQINHPITNQPMKIFITDLERVMKLPTSPETRDGSLLDKIEGWNVT